jgi:hypothetical protein
MKKIHHQLAGAVFVLVASLFMISCAAKEEAASSSNPIQHVTVFQEDGRFAGWPANNGMWNWGNEILVGFVLADHQEKQGHTYDEATSHYKYARSRDGGLTWSIEDAREAGQTAWTYQNQNREKSDVGSLKEPIDFSHPDMALTFSREDNNVGPSLFYYSYDRGVRWNGPYRLPNLDTPGVAARTDYIVNGKNELLAFLTIAKQNKREGRVAMFKTVDGGVTWENKAWLGEEPDAFDIMPSSVRLSPTEILTTIRGRESNPRRDFIKAFYSADNGGSWQALHEPVVDTGMGGSPPALVKMTDGRLALAYAFRSKYGSRICLRLSSDGGRTWSHEIPLRMGDGATNDIGYPRMVQRPDGKLVITYYWNHAVLDGGKPYRYIAGTIVDPLQWE